MIYVWIKTLKCLTIDNIKNKSQQQQKLGSQTFICDDQSWLSLTFDNANVPHCEPNRTEQNGDGLDLVYQIN